LSSVNVKHPKLIVRTSKNERSNCLQTVTHAGVDNQEPSPSLGTRITELRAFTIVRLARNSEKPSRMQAWITESPYHRMIAENTIWGLYRRAHNGTENRNKTANSSCFQH
jgi:hypothetical protein